MSPATLTLEEAPELLNPIWRKLPDRRTWSKPRRHSFQSEVEQLTSSVQERLEENITETVEKTEDLVLELKCALIKQLAQGIFSSPVIEVNPLMDDLYGLCVEVLVISDARKTLKEWIQLLEELKKERIDLPVYPRILGKIDCTPEECGKLLGIGLAKLQTPLRLGKHTDVAEIIREERER